MPKDAKSGVCRGGTRLTSCYYLLMDRFGIRRGRTSPLHQAVEKAAPQTYPRRRARRTPRPTPWSSTIPKLGRRRGGQAPALVVSTVSAFPLQKNKISFPTSEGRAFLRVRCLTCPPSGRSLPTARHTRHHATPPPPTRGHRLVPARASRPHAARTHARRSRSNGARSISIASMRLLSTSSAPSRRGSPRSARPSRRCNSEGVEPSLKLSRLQDGPFLGLQRRASACTTSSWP